MRNWNFAVILCFFFSVAAHAEEPRNTVVITAAKEDAACREDADCERIESTCGACGCRNYIVINKQHRQTYYDQLNKGCANYHGSVCDVYCPGKVVCLQGYCSWEKKQAKAQDPFAGLRVGMLAKEVVALVGEPTAVSRMRMPSGQGNGPIEGLMGRVAPGTPLEEWRYVRGKSTHYVVFAAQGAGGSDLAVAIIETHPTGDVF